MDSLAQIAQCFAYLDYTIEAEKIYLKIINLNPLQDNGYNQMGSFIYFELRNFEKCIELGQKIDQASWIDFDAYMAAACYHLGDMKKMRTNWEAYLNKFKNKISGNSQDVEIRALNWMMEINPYKGRSPMHDFWEFIGEKNSCSEIVKVSPVQPKRTKGTFLKDNGFWQMEYEGKKILLPEVKGFIDIAELVANPEKEVHCAKLMGSVLTESAEILIDETAKKQYQHRILEIQQELDEAEMNNDSAVSLRLQEEYDNLLSHLSSSLGLRNKSRNSGNPVEKARSAITWRIRNAIRKIENAHPELGKHLKISLKTGTFCSYKPEKPVTWIT